MTAEETRKDAARAAQETEMLTKETEYETAKAAERAARDALGQADRALKENRNPDAVQQLQQAYNAAQAAFDTAAAATGAAKFFFEKLRDQQREDNAAYLEELRIVADAERAGREGAMNDAVAAWDTAKTAFTTIDTELTTMQATLAAMADDDPGRGDLETQITTKTTERTTLETAMTTAEGEMATLQTAWEAAEADRIRLEEEAERQEFDAAWQEAKDSFVYEETLMNELEAEVEMWKQMRNKEEDLELWREYDKGMKEAAARRDEQREWFEQASESFEDLDGQKERRAEDAANAAAAAASEAALAARQVAIDAA